PDLVATHQGVHQLHLGQRRPLCRELVDCGKPKRMLPQRLAVGLPLSHREGSTKSYKGLKVKQFVLNLVPALWLLPMPAPTNYFARSQKDQRTSKPLVLPDAVQESGLLCNKVL